MAEQIARAWATRADVDISFDSAGVSDEERGNPIDRRAARVLAEQGYPTGDHRARQVQARELEHFDLVLAFEPHHLRRLKALAPDASHLHLVTDFDPDAAPGSGIADPWYGGAADFEDTFDSIIAALPGIFTELGAPDVKDAQA